jgi:hypothetical protein
MAFKTHLDPLCLGRIRVLNTIPRGVVNEIFTIIQDSYIGLAAAVRCSDLFAACPTAGCSLVKVALLCFVTQQCGVGAKMSQKSPLPPPLLAYEARLLLTNPTP